MTDHVLDLGPIAAGADVNGISNVSVLFAITELIPGDGFNARFLIQEIPEPSTYALIIAGLVVIAIVRLRKRQLPL